MHRMLHKWAASIANATVIWDNHGLWEAITSGTTECSSTAPRWNQCFVRSFRAGSPPVAWLFCYLCSSIEQITTVRWIARLPCNSGKAGYISTRPQTTTWISPYFEISPKVWTREVVVARRRVNQDLIPVMPIVRIVTMARVLFATSLEKMQNRVSRDFVLSFAIVMLHSFLLWDRCSLNST
jgi:hypothetical protein